MMNARIKGDALERAVTLIETVILKSMPAYSEKSFTIQGKRIVVVDGVRHEIDLWVEIDLGNGYKSIFVFECKNWEESVGKNEIIVFTEKIKAVQAQQGFFVAKSFTRYARAQALKVPRLELLLAEEGDHEILEVPLHFHFITHRITSINTEFFEREISADNSASASCVPLQEHSPRIVSCGREVTLEEFVKKFADAAANSECQRLPSDRLPAGKYDLKASAEHDFSPGEVAVDQLEIERMRLTVQSIVEVVRPPIVSKFDIESRGRAISLAPASLGGIELTMAFVETRQSSSALSINPNERGGKP